MFPEEDPNLFKELVRILENPGEVSLYDLQEGFRRISRKMRKESMDDSIQNRLMKVLENSSNERAQMLSLELLEEAPEPTLTVQMSVLKRWKASQSYLDRLGDWSAILGWKKISPEAFEEFAKLLNHPDKNLSENAATRLKLSMKSLPVSVKKTFVDHSLTHLDSAGDELLEDPDSVRILFDRLKTGDPATRKQVSEYFQRNQHAYLIALWKSPYKKSFKEYLKSGCDQPVDQVFKDQEIEDILKVLERVK